MDWDDSVKMIFLRYMLLFVLHLLFHMLFSK